MKPLLAMSFLLVNTVAASTEQSGAGVAIVLAGICIGFVHFSRARGQSTLTSLIELLSYTWSSSWRNIFGGSYADFPVSWFHMIGLVIIVHVILKRRVKVKMVSFFLILCLLALGLFPLVIARNLPDAVSDYLVLLFFYLMVGAIHFADHQVERVEYFSVLDSIVYANVMTSVAIMAQFAVQKLWDYNFIKGSQASLIGGTRLASSLMFGDLSSATVFLGMGVLILIIDFRRFRHPYLAASCIVGGLVLSSARTGFITLIATCGLYTIFNRRHRLRTILILILTCSIGMAAYSSVRQVDSLDALLRDNGRLQGYVAAFRIWSGHPLTGIGFGDKYLSELMQMSVPHFSLLKVLAQTGIVYTLFLVGFLWRYYRISKRSVYSYGRLMFLQSMIGGLFIPGLFSARFLTIVFAVICLQEKIAPNRIPSTGSYTEDS